MFLCYCEVIPLFIYVYIYYYHLLWIFYEYEHYLLVLNETYKKKWGGESCAWLYQVQIDSKSGVR